MPAHARSPSGRNDLLPELTRYAQGSTLTRDNLRSSQYRWGPELISQFLSRQVCLLQWAESLSRKALQFGVLQFTSGFVNLWTTKTRAEYAHTLLAIHLVVLGIGYRMLWISAILHLTLQVCKLVSLTMANLLVLQTYGHRKRKPSRLRLRHSFRTCIYLA
jgi:Ni/Fe-hydrogenase subunit HybB-like protein